MAEVVYLCGDLFFVAKIRSVAEEAGVSVEGAADAEALLAAARGARLVVVDLRRPDAMRALDLLAGDAEASRVRSLGFVDHENVEAMRAAAARGCGRVVSKRKLVSELTELIVG